jgi:hypothetical protein
MVYSVTVYGCNAEPSRSRPSDVRANVFVLSNHPRSAPLTLELAFVAAECPKS